MQLIHHFKALYMCEPQPCLSGKKEGTTASRNGGVPVTDAHMKLNFLHQAAIQVSMQSSEGNDGYAKISRRIAQHFREVLNTERVKIEPDILRVFCSKCKQVFAAKTKRFDLKLIQKKVFQRRCLHCGHAKNYEWNKSYRSRNEKQKPTGKKL